nr:hypothetical protein [uncultured Aquabacterium sp.]
MSDKTLQRLPLALAALLACASAQADFVSSDGKARLSGFGTVGVSRSSTDEALFNTPGQGGGVDKSMGLEPDTKLGVQGSYSFTKTVSATAQVLTKYRADGSYQPEFEWAYAKWQILPSLSVRGGRMGAPFFMISDFRDVGYANTAIRPPLEVYGQVPVSSVDGADISYQTNLGSATVTGTLWGGATRSEYASALRGTSQGVTTASDPVEIRLKKMIGVNLQAEFDGGYALRLGHMQSRLTVNSNSVDSLIRTASGFGLGSVAADALVTQDTKATFTGIGASMDRDNVVMVAEFTKRRIGKGTVADTTGWYVLGGYRFGNLLPYVVVSKLKVDSVNSSAPLTLGPLRPTVLALQSTQYLAQRTTAVGLRWDALRNAAVKVQFDRISKPANSNGLFLVENPTVDADKSFQQAKKNINVISLAVDFVF